MVCSLSELNIQVRALQILACLNQGHYYLSDLISERKVRDRSETALMYDPEDEYTFPTGDCGIMVLSFLW